MVQIQGICNLTLWMRSGAGVAHAAFALWWPTKWNKSPPMCKESSASLRTQKLAISSFPMESRLMTRKLHTFTSRIQASYSILPQKTTTTARLSHGILKRWPQNEHELSPDFRSKLHPIELSQLKPENRQSSMVLAVESSRSRWMQAYRKNGSISVKVVMGWRVKILHQRGRLAHHW